MPPDLIADVGEWNPYHRTTVRGLSAYAIPPPPERIRKWSWEEHQQYQVDRWNDALEEWLARNKWRGIHGEGTGGEEG